MVLIQSVNEEKIKVRKLSKLEQDAFGTSLISDKWDLN